MGELTFDVAVIGGGPAGSTYASLLRKYAPELSVAVFERESFPREHVGESLLPVACRVLDEMGCWEAVESEGFPVKVGATYRWGATTELWDFDFLEGIEYQSVPRPATYQGHRRATAFQVDRSKFDTILLNHAKLIGARVYEETRINQVITQGEEVTHLVLDDGTTIRAKLYIDASGHSGILRRAVGVDAVEPSKIRNVAIWGYWDGASWTSKFGDGATRVLVLSVAFGWIWHIPISENRASIGLIVPADYLKECGRATEKLYFETINADPLISESIQSSRLDGSIHTTKDWSFVAARTAGSNWILVGESAGFADPILAAGISMALVGASDAAALSIEWLKSPEKRGWLMREYDRHQQRRIRSHIHFADYWYTANAQFTDLVENTRNIAAEAGLTLDGKSAWRWLGTGGFLEPLGSGIAGFGLSATHWFAQNFESVPPEWSITKFNRVALNLEGATPEKFALFRSGKFLEVDGYARGNRTIYIAGVIAFLIDTLSVTDELSNIIERAIRVWCKRPGVGPQGLVTCLHALEAMLNDGWVTGTYDPNLKLTDIQDIYSTGLLHKNSAIKTTA